MAMQVLMAEDDVTSRLILQSTLSKWGYEVLAFCDGSEALEGLKAPDAPSLAILDWEMPEMDGVEVCRKLRAMGGKPVYVILLREREAARKSSPAWMRGRTTISRSLSTMGSCAPAWRLANALLPSSKISAIK
jgi:CheY-like chemotaxis protein